MKPQDTHSPGERIGEVRNEQDVRRPREDEPARNPPAVDGGLERREDLRNALHLIENRSCREAMNEADRIVFRGASDGLIVERHVAVAAGLADSACERRLAALPRSVNQDGRGVAERLTQARRKVPREGFRGAWHGR